MHDFLRKLNDNLAKNRQLDTIMQLDTECHL